jgi:Cu/Ag efflux pump CusA
MPVVGLFQFLLYIPFVTIRLLFGMLYYFYTTILPFLVQYIGIPLFVIGCFMGLAASGAVLVTLIVAGIVYYFYMKKVYGVDPLQELRKKNKEQQPQM